MLQSYIDLGIENNASIHLASIDLGMGNNASILPGANGQVHVLVDKQGFTPGDVITGRICLFVTRQIESTGAGLSLSIVGTEKVYYERDTPGGEGGRVRHQRTGTTTFHRTTHTLMPPGTFMPGQYEIPFHMNLPHGIPASMNVHGRTPTGEDYRGSIAYTLDAMLDVKGMLASNIRHEYGLTVLSPPPPTIVPTGATSSADVCFLCCIPTGTATMSAALDKNAYVGGESIQLQFTAHNESTSLVSSATVQLHQRLELSDSSHTPPVHHTPGMSVHSMSRGDVLAIDTMLSTTAVHFPLPNVGSPVKGKPLSIMLQLPVPALTSLTGAQMYNDVQGSHMVCRHWVSVVMNIDWAPDVHAEVPVTVYSPVQLAGQAVALPPPPPDWSPKLMTLVKF